DVKTVSKEFVSFNILEATVGTNTPKGGDGGHGGRTVFRLKDHASTAWQLNVLHDFGEKTVIEQPSSIEIVLSGDAEAETFIDALEFAAQELRKQLKLNKGK